MPEPHILFAPVLKAEGWVSIDLQQQNILEALSAQANPAPMSLVTVPEKGAHLPLIRRFLRDFTLPAQIRAQASAQAGPTVLHVSDHSYGHLCRTHRPCIVNCNDLHHFVTPDLKGLTLWRWKRRASSIRKADRVITVSQNLANEVCSHLDLPKERVTALHGGIDTTVFTETPSKDDSTLVPEIARLRSRHPVILNIGSNIRRKDLPSVLRAMSQLRQKHQIDARLVKIGARLGNSEHQPLIDELQLQDAVIDLGHQTPLQVAAACRQATALAFASLYEGFGRPTLEAQACGLPCVLADASCMKEIGGPESALYHQPGDSADLAEKLHRVLSKPALRDELVRKGHQNTQRFSWTNYATRLREIYRSLA